MTFDKLFTPITVGPLTIKNRILSTGHQTYLAKGNVPSDEMVAYHEARAKGGVGLIVLEAARCHESARSDAPDIIASTDDCIEGFTKIANAIHKHDGKVFGQLSHPGRANPLMTGGAKGVPYSASSTPDSRFRVMPRALSIAMVKDIVKGYADAAKRMAKAGLDGIEVAASFGLLPAQFLNPEVNKRTDEYGGSFENRLRFLVEILERVRKEIGPDMALGIRISSDEYELDGLDADQVLKICKTLDEQNLVDYINTCFGSMAGLGGSIHVVPPMQIDHCYTVPKVAPIKEIVSVPVFVTGRINQPQMAEEILTAGQADMCGMTRALIADPDMPNKAGENRLDDIRACIGCNQACIGHFQLGASISCIQRPTTGRELRYGNIGRSQAPKKVMVIGGGPAGMKAAITAKQRGHDVTLFEAGGQLGGQVKLAQLLPGRSEFGGLATNLARELEINDVSIKLNHPVNLGVIHAYAPDSIILSTGGTPYRPEIERADEAHLVDAWQILNGEANVGARVLVTDWRCDWIGIGIAEKLAREGCHVRLAINGLHAGQELPPYIRDHCAGVLSSLSVEVIPYAKLYGADSNTAYLTHTVTNEAIIMEDVDTIALCLGHTPVIDLEEALIDSDIEIHLAGDCLSPRTAEEAVLEGMQVALKI